MAVLELVAELYPNSRVARRLTLLQLTGGESTAFVDERGRVIAVLGFYHWPEQNGETIFDIWFINRPEASRAMLALTRLSRLTLNRLRQTEGVRLRAFVRPGNRAGQRLARIVGLAFAGHSTIGEEWERWEWSSNASIRSVNRSRRRDRIGSRNGRGSVAIG